MKLKPEEFIVVKIELDIGSDKLGQVVPDLSLEAPRYLRVALGSHATN